MMWTLFATAFKAKRISTLWYSVGGFASIWLYVAIYPSLQAQANVLNSIYKSLPPALLKAFGVSPNLNLEGLLQSKQFGLVWPLLVLFFAVSIAGGALAGEVEKTTIGLWLAAPVSRIRIYWSKYAAGVVALALFVIASVLATIPLAQVYNLSVNSWHILWLAVVGGLFAATVFSLAMMVSSFASSKSTVYGSLSGLLFIMFVLNLVADLNDKLENLKYLSFFYYFNSGDLLSTGALNRWSFIVFGGVAIASAVAGAVIFTRRNISI